MNIQIDWNNKTIIAYGTSLSGPNVVAITQEDYGISDSFGAPKYIFNPLTPPDFTPADITVNPQYLSPDADATANTNARNNVIATVQSTVGVAITNLTTVQVRSLLAALLYKQGAIDLKTLSIKPLNQWL